MSVISSALWQTDGQTQRHWHWLKHLPLWGLNNNDNDDNRTNCIQQQITSSYLQAFITFSYLQDFVTSSYLQASITFSYLQAFVTEPSNVQGRMLSQGNVSQHICQLLLYKLVFGQRTSKLWPVWTANNHSLAVLLFRYQVLQTQQKMLFYIYYLIN